MDTQNTAYGAEELKKIYQKNFRRGLEFAIILHVLIVSAYLIINIVNSVEAGDNKPPVNSPINWINITEPPPIDDNKPIEKPPENIQQTVKDLTSLTPVGVSKEKAEVMTSKTQEELDKIFGNTSREGDSSKYVWVPGDNTTDRPHDDPIKPKHIEPKEDNKDYNPLDVEVQPSCTNLEQIKASLIYPQIALEAGIEGRVTIRVLVGKEGTIIKSGQMTGPDVFYDEVKEKAVNLEFTPGVLGGKPVNVWVTVPFNFKLK